MFEVTFFCFFSLLTFFYHICYQKVFISSSSSLVLPIVAGTKQMIIPTVEIKKITDKKGNIIDKICNVGGIECMNNHKECNCSVYSGDASLPLLFSF